MKLKDMSLVSLCQELKRRHQLKECYNDDDNDDDNEVVRGISTAVVVISIIITLILWIWAILVTIKYWKLLPSWAQIFAILGMFPGLPYGPVITLIVVYIVVYNEKDGRLSA